MNIGPIRILGIDPGLRNTGWGLIEAAGTRLTYVGCGSIHTDAGDFARRAAGADPSRDRPAGRRRAAGRGGGRGDLRQSRPAIDAETRPGARRGAGGAGA